MSDDKRHTIGVLVNIGELVPLFEKLAAQLKGSDLPGMMAGAFMVGHGCLTQVLETMLTGLKKDGMPPMPQGFVDLLDMMTESLLELQVLACKVYIGQFDKIGADTSGHRAQLAQIEALLVRARAANVDRAGFSSGIVEAKTEEEARTMLEERRAAMAAGEAHTGSDSTDEEIQRRVREAFARMTADGDDVIKH